MDEKKNLDRLPAFTRTLLGRAAEAPSYFATPGHHAGRFFAETEAGRVFRGFLGEEIFRADISDSDDAVGDVNAHEGAAGEAERLAARVWQADRTYFVLGGTSAANRAAMEALLAPGDLALIDRNSHKSIYQGLARTGADAVFFGALRNPSGMMGGPSAECFDEAALRRLAEEISPEKAGAARPFRLACLQLVTYDGIYLNAKKALKALGGLCEYILFDSAWGGYENFLPFMTEENPLSLPLSSDSPGLLVTQSVHKQLCGFSQTSQLHLKGADAAPFVFENALAQESSTTPFLPLFAGLEMNAAIHREAGREIWAGALRFAVELRKHIAGAFRHIRPFQPEEIGGKPWVSYTTETIAVDRRFWELRPGEAWHGFRGLTEGALLDPCKVLLVTDFPAELLGKYLAQRGIVAEKTGWRTLLLLVEPGDDAEKAGALLSALTEFEADFDNNSPLLEAIPPLSKEHGARYEGARLADVCREMERLAETLGIAEREAALLSQAHFPRRVMTAREARDALIGADRCLVPLDEAEGRVSLTDVCPYPPGVCLVAAGEIWTREAADFFRALLTYKAAFPGFGPAVHGLEEGNAWVK